MRIVPRQQEKGATPAGKVFALSRLREVLEEDSLDGNAFECDKRPPSRFDSDDDDSDDDDETENKL